MIQLLEMYFYHGINIMTVLTWAMTLSVIYSIILIFKEFPKEAAISLKQGLSMYVPFLVMFSVTNNMVEGKLGKLQVLWDMMRITFIPLSFMIINLPFMKYVNKLDSFWIFNKKQTTLSQIEVEKR